MTTTAFDDMTVQELLDQHLDLGPILQALNISADGSATLADVATSKGWPPRILVDIIATATAAVRGEDLHSARAPAARLRGIAIDCVRADHRLLRRDLDRLSDLVDGAIEGCSHEGKATLQDFQAVFAGVQKQLLTHFIIEEQVLFPRLRRGDHHSAAGSDGSTGGDSPATAVAEMEREHEMLDAMFGEMRDVMAKCDLGPEGAGVVAAVNDGLALLEADLRQHARIENDLLWPGALLETEAAGDADATSVADAGQDEACPRTGRPCEQGASAVCTEFWECVRSAMEQRWDEAGGDAAEQGTV